MKFFFYCLPIVLLSTYLFCSCDEQNNSNSTNPTGVSKPPILDSIVYSKIAFDTISKTSFLYNSSVYPILNPIKGYQGVPTLVHKDGVLFAAWDGGNHGEELNQYIIVSTSLDMGNTWEENKLIIAPLKDSIRHFDSSLWLDKFKNIHLSWTMSKGMWDGGRGGIYETMLHLEDNNITITPPRRLFAGAMCVRPIQSGLDNSSMLFPVYGYGIGQGWSSGQFFYGTLPEILGPSLYSATYDEKNKRINNPVLLSRIPRIYPSTFDEHSVVSIGKDSLLCLLRKNIDGLCTNLSVNNGKTWQGEQKFKQLEGGIMCSSRPYIGKLKSGNLLIVFNNSSQREKMTAFLSKDKGKTWPYKLLIDERRTVSYPSVVQNDIGEICLVYDYNRYPNGRIMFTKFTEEDIIEGTKKPELVIISMVK
ncbi:sialidase family protein [Flavobacterium sp. MC2016-06]|jgi:hypothetical protein|uniref:sialidase family protein n=1 Tax=Flavobacterium sp. MC2016-06 TaxID=2676308 RepID=UPI0012BA6991|nr:sialidase family protein [Flavobacterium sp. MC2016-06]MBU3862046.1 glycoside hydrolase [Flavobacterium sp. MC2016-06]